MKAYMHTRALTQSFMDDFTRILHQSQKPDDEFAAHRSRIARRHDGQSDGSLTIIWQA